MGKTKVVKKTTAPPKVSASQFQRTSKNSVKTGGRTTMNSSATALMSIPARTVAKKPVKKGAAGGNSAKPKAKAKDTASKKVAAVKTAARKMRSAAVAAKSKAKPVPKPVNKKQSKPSKGTKPKETGGTTKKVAESKKIPAKQRNQSGGSKTSKAGSSADEAPKQSNSTVSNNVSAVKKKVNQKEKENTTVSSKKTENSDSGNSVKAVKAPPTRSKSSDSTNQLSGPSRTPSRRESASSTNAASRSRKNSLNSTVGSIKSNSSSSKGRDRLKEPSPAPKSRRSTLSTEKRKSKSPSPKPARNRSQSGSSIKEAIKEEDNKIKPNERSRRKSGTASEMASPPLSPSSSVSARQPSPSPRVPAAKKAAAKATKTKTVSSGKESEKSAKVVVKEEPKTVKGKNTVKSEDGAKTSGKSTTTSTQSKQNSTKEPNKRPATSPPPKAKGTAMKKESDGDSKSTKDVKAKPKTVKKSASLPTKKLQKVGIGKRQSTLLASAASKSKAQAIKSLLDDRAVVRKLASKAIKTKSKPKPKPKLKMRPKLKKRMASLNAKAILEASFSNEQLEKKPKAASPPKQSPGKQQTMPSAPTSAEAARLVIDNITSTSELAARYENLLSDLKIEIRSGPPPQESSYNSPPSPSESRSSESEKPPRLSKKRKSKKSVDEDDKIDKKTSSSRKDSLSISTMTSVDTGTSTSAFTVSPNLTIRERKSHEIPPASSRRTGSYDEEQQSISKSKKSPKTTKTAGESTRSPVPLKKAKKEVSVATAETSTSTPSWGWEPYIPPYPHPALSGYSVESTMIHQEPGIRHSQQHYTAHSSQGTSLGENHLEDGYAAQSQRYEGLTLHPEGHQYHTKENKSNTPVAHYGSGTVYQPAGPLIEPHKHTGSSSGLAIPETVRLPPDLKVTYQTRPLGNSSSSKESTSTQSSKSSHKGGHPSKAEGHGRSSSSSGKSSRSGGQHSSKSSGSQSAVLHQPYKSSTSSSSSHNGGSTISSARTVKVQHQQSLAPPAATTTPSTSQLNNNSNFSVFGSSGATLMGAPGSASTISHQHTLASTNVSLTAHHPGFSGTAPSQGMYYHPNYMGAPAHHSPFAPNKYPIVPPDSFRSPYPSSFMCGPGAPQTSGNFYMTPFYTPPMTPTSVPVLGSQPRGMLPSHSAAAAATAYYQSTLGPPSAAATSQHGGNYGMLSPAAASSSSQLQPSLHSIPSQSSPGHAGPFRPNLSSHPACPCPTDSSLPQNTSISITNSKYNNTTSTRPLPRLQQLQQQRLPPRCAIPAMRQGSEITVHPRNRNTASNATRVKDSPTQPLACTTPAVAAGAPKTLSVHNSSIDVSENRHVECAKTYTEQYSLPDDITITPIRVPEPAGCTSKIQSGSDSINRTNLHSSANYRNVSKFHGNQKPKDIVHVIDPRSGQTTTIAKHISNTSNLSFYLNNQKKNVSPVKPNNAGNVGKINPDLDVIVIPPGQNRDQISEIVAQSQMRNKRVFQTSALTSSNSANVFNQHFSIRPALSDKGSLTSTAVNLVQPLPQVSGHNHISGVMSSKRFSENPGKSGVKRKGILECIDGLQKKKQKMLEQETSGPGMYYGLDRSKLLVQPKSPPSAARAMARDQIFQMRNSTIVNEREAVAAASALVVPPNGAHVRLSPHKNGLKRGKGWSVSELSSSVPHKAKGGNLKITTRSSIANAKIKTRSSLKDRAGYVLGPTSRPIATSTSPEQRTRHRLLRRRINHSASSKDHGWAHRRFPQSQRFNFVQRWKKAHEESSSASPGSSETSSSSNGGGPSGITGKSGYASTSVDRGPGYSRSAIPVTSSISARTHGSVEASGRFRAQIPGSMAFNALKKRAIVKPLSPNVMNGALHSMMLARRQPKWSNGWRFEGEAFEAKVYLRNDDQPVIRRCYPAMRHDGGDTIQARDCVLLKSGPRKTDLPFVAKVAALWENPTDGEMMFSLLWYYRPEHTELGRTQEDMSDEIFASKHRDCNSVATIEDRCYVLTLNEYCRYKKRLKQLEEGISTHQPLVPLSDSLQSSFSNFAANIALAVWQGKQQGEERRVPAAGKVSPEVVFFCRKVYDFRQKRLLKNPS